MLYLSTVKALQRRFQPHKPHLAMAFQFKDTDELDSPVSDPSFQRSLLLWTPTPWQNVKYEVSWHLRKVETAFPAPKSSFS